MSRTTISLRDQPELRIDFNKLVSTGTLSANGASVYRGELGLGWRNLPVQGEYYQLGVTQANCRKFRHRGSASTAAMSRAVGS